MAVCAVVYRCKLFVHHLSYYYYCSWPRHSIAHRRSPRLTDTMVAAWFMDDDTAADQRLPHQTDPLQPVSLAQLRAIGVLHWTIPVAGHEVRRRPVAVWGGLGSRPPVFCSRLFNRRRWRRFARSATTPHKMWYAHWPCCHTTPPAVQLLGVSLS